MTLPEALEDVSIACSSCGQDLAIDRLSTNGCRLKIMVAPCETCFPIMATIPAATHPDIPF